MDYIQALSGETFLELHGDRTVKDDKAMVGGFGKLVIRVFIYWSQKGFNTKTRQYRNFGMANPRVIAKPFDL
ncbi:MAG: hypothetical protein CM15mP32_1410 [Flavobacteriaceae bacterium]|nr:MAG: hypothetical protein CM15mP32_1410 [Flavobacteriaceae bacterium]